MDLPSADDPLLRRTATLAGWSDDDLARLTRSGSWARLRRGAYLPGEMPESLAARHRLVVVATMAGLRRPAVVSHASAAALHGFPLWRIDLSKVHVTRRPPASTETRGVLRCHVGRLRDHEVVRRNGLQVTSPARTALDLARTSDFERAVVLLDAVLNRRLVDATELRERLFDLAGVPGSRAAGRAVAFADGRSESVGESRSRIVLARAGLAPSVLQLEVATVRGITYRTDFGWEEHRLVGEFDGRVKYDRLLRPGQEPGDAVFEEKRREDAIRDEGWGMVRWTWADVAVPGRLDQRVRRALQRAGRR